MNKLIGRRFIFGIFAMACITVMSCYLKFDGETVLKLVGAITGMFLTSQTVTDYQKGSKNG